MSSETYDLVFSGELVRGADPADARRKLGALFKISEAKVEVLFSGKPVTLKKSLDFATATKYRVAIKKAGCRVDLVENKAKVETPAGGNQGKAVFAAQELSSQQAAPAKPQTVSKPANDAAVEAPLSPPNSRPAQAPVSSPQVESKVEAVVESRNDSPPLPVVEEVEAAPPPPLPEVDSDSSFDLAPLSGNLVDSSELEHAEPVYVEIGDISIKSEGGDLLNDDEKRVYETLEIDMDAELAPAGADLLNDNEREVVDVVEIDLSDFSVAEPGADLGQEKEDKPELNPDISHLSLQS